MQWPGPDRPVAPAAWTGPDRPELPEATARPGPRAMARPVSNPSPPPSRSLRRTTLALPLPRLWAARTGTDGLHPFWHWRRTKMTPGRSRCPALFLTPLSSNAPERIVDRPRPSDRDVLRPAAFPSRLRLGALPRLLPALARRLYVARYRNCNGRSRNSPRPKSFEHPRAGTDPFGEAVARFAKPHELRHAQDSRLA